MSERTDCKSLGDSVGQYPTEVAQDTMGNPKTSHNTPPVIVSDLIAHYKLQTTTRYTLIL
jgi:hypothetical protein